MYTQIHQSFWTDRKVQEDCTPEERYFLLYLMTNPHGTISGCYELGFKQMSFETGYAEDAVRNLISRLQDVHRFIVYDPDTREVLVLNWYRYNWSRSDRFLAGIRKAIPSIKSESFREHVSALLDAVIECDSIDTVSIPYQYRIHHIVNVYVNDTVTDTVSDSEKRKKEERTKETKEPVEKKQLTTEEQDLEDAFKEFRKYRRKIKAELTPEGEKRIRAKLEKAHPGDPAKQAHTIRYCIDRGWRGVFPPGDPDKPKKRKDEETTNPFMEILMEEEGGGTG